MSDMKRVFVVEYLDPKPNPKEEDQWWHIGTHDDEPTAIQQAKDDPRDTRVRQFWVESAAPQTKVKVGAFNIEAPQVDLSEFKCINHPTNGAKAYPGGGTPRCPDCKSAMVPASFIAGMANPKELK